MQKSTTTVFGSIAILLMTAMPVLRADDGFTATLEDCTEMIGFGPVPMAIVRPLVPSNYTIVELGPGTAGLVVRAARCEQVRIGSSPAKPASVGQIGIAIIAPDGSGDINNYTLFYATSSVPLAEALRDAGLPAGLDSMLAVEFTPSPSGEVYAAVAPPGVTAWFVSGSASEPPPGSGAPVTANWWFQTRRGNLKMATTIPAINYGAASFALHTSKQSSLGQIIGGNTDGNFIFFNARGVFSTGTMKVSSK